MESVGIYEYSSKDIIGHGAFAVVYKGRVKMRPNQVVAIKAITKKNLAKSQSLLGKEIKILKELTELHHENVVALLDCKETPNHVYLVMEYCNGGDLADYLNAKGTLSEDTIRLFLRQLAGAMKAMMSKGIVHRDLKPQNILLSHDGRSRNPQPHEFTLKIADFGFARFLSDGVMAATLCGSPMYMAPEVIMSLQYDAKADLWSLGTIVFQCLTGKAPFQAQTPQALKLFYEKNAVLAPRLPSGTSPLLADLLTKLLKRNAKDRIEFEDFFAHQYILVPVVPPPPPAPTKPVSVPTAVPSAGSSNSTTPRNSVPCSHGQSPAIPGMLPPSPVVREFHIGSPKQQQPRPVPMESSGGQHQPPKKDSPEEDPDDFVMVPDHLAKDAAENRKARNPPSQPSASSGRRHTVGGRPVSLNVARGNSEPIPVPSQKEAYQQIQQSLFRSRSKSGDSVSAMSGVSSASGGSTLGPLPEDGIAASPATNRRSPTSPRSPTKAQMAKTRRVSCPPIPDICQMSPPSVQFTMGTPPPPGHRRRTSSSSSCGTPPPSLQWQVSPNSPSMGRHMMTTSPIRKPSLTTQKACPGLPPILGSPAISGADEQQSMALVPWDQRSGAGNISMRARTVPENLCTSGEQPQPAGVDVMFRPASELHLASGRNVVLNYGQMPAMFNRSNSLTSLARRNSSGKENAAPPPLPEPFVPMPPPDLSEETLLAPEHNEIVAKLKFISMLVDTIIDVARQKGAPLSALTESVTPKNVQPGYLDPNSPLHRRVQQLLLYMRCLTLLQQTLEFARAELKSKKLKPSTTVKNILATLNERFRHCISMTKMLNSENILLECGIDPQNTGLNADKILFNHAIEQCQSAALDELFGNPDECFQRYHGAHVLLHALQFQTNSDEEKTSLTRYKEAVEKRLHILEEQGFIQAYEVMTT